MHTEEGIVFHKVLAFQNILEVKVKSLCLTKRHGIVFHKVLAFQNILKAKVKVKLSLCLTKHHAMKTYWGVEV
jgi:hypothetical protein